MRIIVEPTEITAWANQALRTGKSIGLVPTMGYFHEGHLALMRRAKELADQVVVSLFVNPTQFAPGEDLARYPRDFVRDRQLAEAQGVDLLFVPEVSGMYSEEARTRVVVSGISQGLCGRSRPGHFEGVATVVAKLFNLVKPQVAVFGEKDFQQLAVIRRMVADLNWDIRIVGHPIVREPDGLAMSSRNSYLSPAERRKALCLYQAISHARKRLREGLSEAKVLLAELQEIILRQEGVEIDYISFVSPDELTPVGVLQDGIVLAMAVKVGKTRLIDNDTLKGPESLP
ncbi:pantoate--beta-alanine ligase [Thiovibrio sp. JS02]